MERDLIEIEIEEDCRVKPCEPLLDIWIPLSPRGKGRAMFRSIPRPDAPYIEREIDPETGAPLIIDPESNVLHFAKKAKHYTLKNIRPMAYGESTSDHEREVRDIIVSIVSREEEFKTLSGAVRIDWVAYFPFLLSDPPRVKAAKVRGEVSHIKKPDRDNIEKLLFDAMNQIVYMDDCQIDFGTCAKVYSEREGIRARVYNSDPRKVRAWVEANFPWEEEPFQLEG